MTVLVGNTEYIASKPIETGTPSDRDTMYYDTATSSWLFGIPTHSHVGDLLGVVFDVREYGATGDGVTDDTSAINLAIAAAGAADPNGTVYFPRGFYKTTGNHEIGGYKGGLKIRGDGPRATQIITAHATNDIFKASLGRCENFELTGMTFTSKAITSANSTFYDMYIGDDASIRTGGWCINFRETNGSSLNEYSKIEDIEIVGQYNGIRIYAAAMAMVNRIYGWGFAGTSATGGVGLVIGENAAQDYDTLYSWGLLINEVQFWGSLLKNQGDNTLDYGMILRGLDSVDISNCWVGGTHHESINILKGHHLRVSNTHFDYSESDGLYIDGTGMVTIIGCEIYNSGGGLVESAFTGRGLSVRNSSSVNITGCLFANNKNGGAHLYRSYGTMTGCSFSGCGQPTGYGIYVEQQTLGDASFTITGCQETGFAEYSIGSNANANKLQVVGNNWNTASLFAVKPLVDAHNVEASVAVLPLQTADMVGGRLDLVSTASIKWRFLNNNQITLYNSGWELIRASAEPTLANTASDMGGNALAVDKIYDIFAVYSSTTAFTLAASSWAVSTLGASARTAAWVTSTGYYIGDRRSNSGSYYVCVIAHTSGTFATDLAAGKWVLCGTNADDFAGLYQKDGIWVSGNNTNHLKMRWLGVIYTYNNAATVNFKDDAQNRLISNFYNPSKKTCRAYNSTASWAYGTNAWREQNAGTGANKTYSVSCVTQDIVTSINAKIYCVSDTYSGIGIGKNVTNAQVAAVYLSAGPTGGGGQVGTVVYNGSIFGYNYFTAVETSPNAVEVTYYGTPNGEILIPIMA